MTFSVGTRFEKQNRFRDVGRGVVSGIDWSEDISSGGEQKSVSFEESCRSRHVTRLVFLNNHVIPTRISELYQLATHVTELV